MQFIPSMLHITTKGLPRVMARADMSVVSALKARTRRALCSVLAAAIAGSPVALSAVPMSAVAAPFAVDAPRGKPRGFIAKDLMQIGRAHV